MPDTSIEASARPTESGRRWHAALRAVLSPGIWLVLAAQIALVLSLQWRVATDASPLAQGLAILLTTAALMLFFYLQAGAFHALSLSRNTVTVGEIVRVGKTVFAAFVWLTLKAGLLLVVILNALMYVAVLTTGQELKTIIETLSRFFSPAVGMLAFVFVYWLPLVFVRREFRLLPSLQAALQIAWARLSQAAFLVLLVLVPILISGFIPGGSVVVDLLVSVASGLMAWIAYIYCIGVLQDHPQQTGSEAPI